MLTYGQLTNMNRLYNVKVLARPPQLKS